MLISEIYKSVQGEGVLTGTESVFVRTAGCNLRCGFCDTPFTSWHIEGRQRSVADIVRQVTEMNCDHVVITGGEPMLPREIEDLTDALHEKKLHITMETAGTVHRAVCADLMSISPKLTNSVPSLERAGEWRARHEATRHAPAVIRRLLADFNYQLKFVVDRPEDCDEIVRYLQEFPGVSRECVLLMPQGTTVAELSSREDWLQPICQSQGFRFCPRKHIEWFGHQRGV